MRESLGRYFPWILGALILIGAGLRLHELEADPPLGLSWSQGLYTDGAVVVQNARNQVLWGRPVLDYGIDMYWFPLSYVSNLVSFSMFGVSTKSARLPSIVLSLATIACIGLGVRSGRSGSRAEGDGGDRDWRRLLRALVASLLLVVSFPFLMYNRLPLAEPAMILLTALSFLFFCLGSSRGSLKLLGAAGFFAVAAPLFGKAHAVYIPLVGLLALALGPKPQRLPKHFAWYLGGCVAAFALWVAVLLVPFGKEIIDHYLHESIVKHTSSADSSSFFADALDNVITMGQTRGVGFLARDFPMLLLSFAALPLLLVRRMSGRGTEGAALRFAWLWLIIGYCFLACVKWVAPRYLTVLFPAMAILAAGVLFPPFEGEAAANGAKREKGKKGERRGRRPAALGVVALFAVSYLSSLVIIANFGATQRIFRIMAPFARIVPDALSPRYPGTLIVPGVVAALLVSALLLLFVGRMRPPSVAVAALLLVPAMLWQGVQYVAWSRESTRSVIDAGRLIGRTLGGDAHILGSYAPALTLDNRLRASPYFGPEYMGPDHDPNLFEEYGITHVVLAAEGDFITLQERYPDVIDGLEPVGRFEFASLWSPRFVLFRVPNRIGLRRIHDYRPTEAELRMGAAFKEEMR